MLYDTVYVRIKKPNIWDSLIRMWELNGDLTEKIVGADFTSNNPSYTSFVSGHMKNAVKLDPTGSGPNYLMASLSSNVSVTNNIPKTITFWVKRAVPGIIQWIHNGVSGATSGQIIITDNNTLRISGAQTTPPYTETVNTFDFINDYRFVCVNTNGQFGTDLTGTNFNIYVDGILQPKINSVQPWLTGQTSFSIGGGYVQSTTASIFVEQFAVFNKQLTYDEISILFNGGNGLMY